MMASSATKLLIGADMNDNATCGICHRQVSRYTCPSCNVTYCSLACFRSNGHSQCSEGFYKQQLESDIRSQPSVGMDERKRMLEVLRRFEEETTDEDLLCDDEERNRDDLAERLSRVDLASASATDIWNVLTPDERETFLNKLADPASPSVQELLRRELSIVLPWWEALEDLLEDSSSQARTNMTYGVPPVMEEISKALLARSPGPDAGPPLLYNICAVLVAYSFATRHLGVSPLSQSRDEEDLIAARGLLQILVPFVADKRSTVLLGSMDDVVTDMWVRLVDSKRADRALFALFLRDAARFLDPQRIAEVYTSSDRSSLEGAPQRVCLLALSDLAKLFKSRGGRPEKETPASLKLRFYAAHIMALPPPLLSAFSAEVESRAHYIESEGTAIVQEGCTTKPERKPVPHIVEQESDKRHMIEEL